MTKKRKRILLLSNALWKENTSRGWGMHCTMKKKKMDSDPDTHHSSWSAGNPQSMKRKTGRDRDRGDSWKSLLSILTNDPLTTFFVVSFIFTLMQLDTAPFLLLSVEERQCTRYSWSSARVFLSQKEKRKMTRDTAAWLFPPAAEKKDREWGEGSLRDSG